MDLEQKFLELASSTEERWAAMCELIEVDKRRAFDLLADASAKDADPTIRYNALLAISRMRSSKIDVLLQRGLSDADPTIRAAVIPLLHQRGDGMHLAIILSSILDPSFIVRTQVVRILEALEPDHARAVVAQALEHEQPERRAELIAALEHHGLVAVTHRSAPPPQRAGLKIQVAMTAAYGYHFFFNDFANHPPENACFFHSHAELIDEEDGPHGLRFEAPRDLVYSNKAPVLNDVPWVMTFDDLIFNYYIRETEMAAMCAGRLPYDVPRRASGAMEQRLQRMLGYFASDNCKALLPRSEWAKRALFAATPDPRVQKKTKVLYQAVPLPSAWHVAHDGINIIFVGKEFQRKGGEDMLEAFHCLRRRRADVSLTYVGDVPDPIKPAHEGVGVTFLGPLSRAELTPYYARADIFALPTRMDSWGIVYIEAMSYGLPIVTTTGSRLPASKEIIHEGENGFLIEQVGADGEPTWHAGQPDYQGRLDLDQFVDALDRLCGDVSLRDEISRRNRDVIEHGRFSLVQRNQTLGEIFDRARAG
jgi:glycosyltransferase involved in cell wall biosynthesis